MSTNNKQTEKRLSIAHRKKGISLDKLDTLDNIDQVKREFNRHLHYTLVKDRIIASNFDYFCTLALVVKDHLIARWLRTQQLQYEKDPKRVYWLSLEYYMGKTLTNSMINIGIKDLCKKAMYEFGLDLEELADAEEDAGLGNGGLGMLAACFLDSLATLGLSAHGYGLRYEYGLFKQRIVNGEQIEEPDDWLAKGYIWEASYPKSELKVHLYGKVDHDSTENKWIDTEVILAVPYDYPIPGFENNVVNTMRLWTAKSPNNFNLQFFNDGDYVNAVLDRCTAENITKVLYPTDKFFHGKELRLKQEYFLVSATVQDIIQRYKMLKNEKGEEVRKTFKEFPEKVAIQLNGAHPSLAILELMRIFLDFEHLSWDEAWDITIQTCAYTCHTSLPEASEKWSMFMFGNLLPRHLEIIFEINERFLKKVKSRWPDDSDRLSRMSLIEEGGERRINMTYLAVIGSHIVNGLSVTHSDILKKESFKDFYEMTPEKFQNITKGITPRRWLLLCNPNLADAISEKIGHNWITHLEDLKQLKSYLNDTEFVETITKIKYENKSKLANYIYQIYNIRINLNSMFDIQVTRIHEYKRNLLKCLHIIYMYNKIKKDPNAPFVSRTVIMGGKAAPGYRMAKDIIRLISAIANKVNNDSAIGLKLKVVYLENYGVTLAEKVIPAADLSEQIATAGSDASGTGGMKFMMNGALTIGTLDGANKEMRDEAGDENFFIFGMTAGEVKELVEKENYDAESYYNRLQDLKEAVDQIKNGYFSASNPNLFENIYNNLMFHDEYFVFADYEAYVQCQERVNQAFINTEKWTKMAIMNIASSGKFSSDRAIFQYATEIWGIQPTWEKLPDPKRLCE